MDKQDGTAAPQWEARFLEALRTGQGVRAACRTAGVATSTPYHLRARDDAFRAEWDAIQPADGRTKRKTSEGGARRGPDRQVS